MTTTTPLSTQGSPTTRMPSRNIAQPVYFVLRGSQKRRDMAQNKAQQLQRELGVAPRLTCVK